MDVIDAVVVTTLCPDVALVLPLVVPGVPVVDGSWVGVYVVVTSGTSVPLTGATLRRNDECQ